MTASAAFNDWANLARATPILRPITERGIRLRGTTECVGPCPRCGGTDRFSINTKKQVFNCRGCGIGGDVIALVAHLDDSDFIGACEALTGASCPTGERGKPISPQHKQELEQRREAYAREAAERELTARADAKHKGELAAWLWQQSVPITEACLAACYLRRRRINIAIPPALRFLPASDRHPASMIARFGASGSFASAVHITRLTPDGDRERGEKAKIIIGQPRGQPIVLAPATEDVLAINVAEGIENGLSCLQEHRCEVWVAGNAGLLPALAPTFPAWVEAVTVYCDRDKVGILKGLELGRAIKHRIPEVHVIFIGKNEEQLA